jgi:hypothetical protein
MKIVGRIAGLILLCLMFEAGFSQIHSLQFTSGIDTGAVYRILRYSLSIDGPKGTIQGKVISKNDTSIVLQVADSKYRIPVSEIKDIVKLQPLDTATSQDITNSRTAPTKTIAQIVAEQTSGVVDEETKMENNFNDWYYKGEMPSRVAFAGEVLWFNPKYACLERGRGNEFLVTRTLNDHLREHFMIQGIGHPINEVTFTTVLGASRTLPCLKVVKLKKQE